MPVRVKPVAEVADKWAEVTPGRSSYYNKGVAGAGNDYVNGALAAAGAFKAAVSAGNIDKLYVGGVKKAGAEKYTRKATGVGTDRFGPGVTAAKGDYSGNVAPYLDEISKQTLPARAPRGSDSNFARVTQIGKALHLKRLAIKGAGA